MLLKQYSNKLLKHFILFFPQPAALEKSHYNFDDITR
uniref:Uncharacterized protein n=1 Tax=Arundo donax TaxID=35708 RepID=A0A0A9CSW9_ARUDO